MAPPAQVKPEALFSHGDRAVFVLIPNSLLDSRACVEHINDLTEKMEKKPELITAIPISGMPLEAIIYVAHPVKTVVKTANGRKKTNQVVHISAPIDVTKDAVTVGRNNYRTVNADALARATSKACKNVDGGRFFRGVVRGEGHKDPAAVVLTLTDM